MTRHLMRSEGWFAHSNASSFVAKVRVTTTPFVRKLDSIHPLFLLLSLKKPAFTSAPSSAIFFSLRTPLAKCSLSGTCKVGRLSTRRQEPQSMRQPPFVDDSYHFGCLSPSISRIPSQNVCPKHILFKCRVDG